MSAANDNSEYFKGLNNWGDYARLGETAFGAIGIKDGYFWYLREF